MACSKKVGVFPEIRPWSECASEYLVLEKFPRLRKRLETGLDCLTTEQREQLRLLVQRRESELRATGHAYLTPLHHKVCLLAGANLAHLAVDAVVNASNHWLTPGKGMPLIIMSINEIQHLHVL